MKNFSGKKRKQRRLEAGWRCGIQEGGFREGTSFLGEALFFEFLLVAFDARFVTFFGLGPVFVTAIAGIGKHRRFRILLEHDQTCARLDNAEIMSVDVTGLSREGGFDHMARRTPPGPFGLGRIAVFGVFADGAPRGESFVFPVAGKAQIVVIVRF